MEKYISPEEKAEELVKHVELYLTFMPKENRRHSSIEIAQVFCREVLEILQDDKRIPNTHEIGLLYRYWNEVDDILADMEHEEYHT